MWLDSGKYRQWNRSGFFGVENDLIFLMEVAVQGEAFIPGKIRRKPFDRLRMIPKRVVCL